MINRLDIALGNVVFWADYHGGQGSEGYLNLCRAQALLDRMGYRPGYNGPKLTDSDGAEEVYDALQDEHGAA